MTTHTEKGSGRIIRFRAWDGNKLVGPIEFGEFFPDNGIIRRTLMQFTGLLDRHGKEMFEGDLIRMKTATDDVVGDVRWDGDRAAFYVRFHEFDYYMPSGAKPERIEIIGNRFEQPELLGTYPASFKSEEEEETKEPI